MSQDNTAYQRLSARFNQIAQFEHLNALGDWDQATMMPPGGSEARAGAMAELAKHIHQLKSEPQVGEWLEYAQDETLTSTEQANLREMQYHYGQATVVPSDLVEAKTKQAYACEHAWREQRANNDWQGFAPNLKKVINLVREEAQIRGEQQQLSPYDALLQKFEPGMDSQRISDIFNQVKSWLPQLISQIQAKQQSQASIVIPPYSADSQAKLGRAVMSLLGFDFNHGRLDISSHPFCGGSSSDIRLTTRFDESDFTSGLMGIIHETGHARYEQGLPIEWRGQPAGQYRSMAIHESQSLFFEMQMARGSGFLSLLAPLLKQHLGSELSLAQLQQIYSRVEPGFIRVDADEVTYPCHIMLRFEAEQAMVNGELTVDDLPDFWDQHMQQLLGLSTKGNDKMGCMQDIHWPVGELGYFPSYSLGAMYAAQFKHSIEAQLGDIDSLVSAGKLNDICAWLQQNIWSKGALLTTDELVKHATGESLNPDHFKHHLQQRYL